MAKRMSSVVLKKRLAVSAARGALVVGMLVVSVSAWADAVPVIEVNPGVLIPLADIAGATTDTAANTLLANYYLENINSALDAFFAANGASETGVAATVAASSKQAADTMSLNARTDTLAATSEGIAVNNLLPPNATGGTFSKCAVSQSARAKTDLMNLEANAAHALVRGAANRPSGPAGAAADLKARMTLGMVPCTTATDPDAQTGQALGCAPKWGGQFEGADMTKSALFDHLQLLVPPNYVQPVSGTYQPLPTVTDVKYMPFVAAYSYCMHLTPRRSVAPMAATAEAVMSTQNFSDLTSKSNEALDECMSLLEERAQYASSGMPGTKYPDMYTDQYTSCVDDEYDGIIDDATDCKTNGRSALQAMYDSAYRVEAAGYSAGYLAGADRATLMAEERTAYADEAAFDAYIQREKMLLNQAIASTQSSASGVYTSPMSSIVK